MHFLYHFTFNELDELSQCAKSEQTRKVCEWLEKSCGETGYEVPGLNEFTEFHAEEGKLVLGYESPEEIQRIAKEWNRSIIGDVQEILRLIEEAAARDGYAKLSDYVASSPDMLPAQQLCGATWGDLSDALALAENKEFTAAADPDKLIVWKGYFTAMVKWILNDINDHPEQWVYIDAHTC